MILDTHVHLIYRNRLSYPWLKSVEALDNDATYDDYQRTARRIGISGALHMEVDVADEDRDAETDMVRSLMELPDSLIRGAIASCRPESDNFASWFDLQIERAEVKGLRRVLHVAPDELSTTSLFRENVKRLADTSMTFDLCVLPSQIPLAIELVDYCPRVSFVLDHCGVPDIKGGAFEPWKTHIAEMSRRENVTAKISGVMAYTDTENWTLDDIRPFVEHTISKFGWNRVVWGSDSPVCTLGGHLETWVAATHALLNNCSADEKGKLLFHNARNLWNLTS